MNLIVDYGSSNTDMKRFVELFQILLFMIGVYFRRRRELKDLGKKFFFSFPFVDLIVMF